VEDEGSRGFRDGDNCNFHRALGDEILQPIHWKDRYREVGVLLGGIVVETREHADALLLEFSVVHEGGADPATADDNHVLSVLLAEDGAELVHQVVDIVSTPLVSLYIYKGEVLADNGGGYSNGVSEIVGENVYDTEALQFLQNPQISDQPQNKTFVQLMHIIFPISQ